MSAYHRHPASFRDPAGFVFERDGKYYRQVNNSYADDYRCLMGSGLYQHLTDRGVLIPHREVPLPPPEPADGYLILEPEQLQLITYPSEWCFHQLKDAALLTLDLTLAAIRYDMVLKDATPYNIQFLTAKPMWIDSLSFARYDETKPWVAYRQFCMQFLAPLYLAHYTQAEVNRLFIAYPAGVPIPVATSLLPYRSRLHSGAWLHLFLQHAITSKTKTAVRKPSFSRKKMIQLINHLRESIHSLHPRNKESHWSVYYAETISGDQYLQHKELTLLETISDMEPCTVLDLGTNNGHFARLLAQKGFTIIAADQDATSIDHLYLEARSNSLDIQPVVFDIAEPAGAAGFMNKERETFHHRVRTKLVLALALLHHLAIAKNIPLSMLAEYFASVAPVLAIEWIPREDDKIKQMLASGDKHVRHYSVENFEASFSEVFIILKKIEIGSSGRWIYLMKKRQ